jgi:hypothetical protein
MRKRSGAGSLSEEVAFRFRSVRDDGFGNNVSGDWEERFIERARLQPRLGSEAVIASRLSGVQPFTLTVRSNERTRCVDAGWSVVNKRSGKVYNVLTNVNIDERNAWQELLVTEGVPV